MTFSGVHQLWLRATSNLVPSPLVPTSTIAYGYFNRNRTSNLSIEYPPRMVLTPWPILIASVGLSLLICLIGYLGARSGQKKHDQGTPTSPHRIMKAITMIGLLISTIRVIAFVVLAIRINQVTSLPSPSSMLLFVSSLLPYTVNQGLPEWMRIIAQVEFIVTFSIAAWINYSPAIKDHGYGQLTVSGGNCPTVSQTTCSQLSHIGQYTGCLPNSTNLHQNLTVQIEFLNVTEQLFAALAIIYGVLFVGGLAIVLLGRATVRGVTFFSPRYKAVVDEDKRISKHKQNPWASQAGMTWVATIVAVIIIIIIVPEHVFAESNPSTYSVIDGFGPEVSILNPAYTGNATSWKDCFDLRPPADRLGFATFWWQQEESRVLHILAGL